LTKFVEQLGENTRFHDGGGVFFFFLFGKSFSRVGKFVFKFVLKLAKNEFFEFYSYMVLKKIKRFKNCKVLHEGSSRVAKNIKGCLQFFTFIFCLYLDLAKSSVGWSPLQLCHTIVEGGWTVPCWLEKCYMVLDHAYMILEFTCTILWS